MLRQDIFDLSLLLTEMRNIMMAKKYSLRVTDFDVTNIHRWDSLITLALPLAIASLTELLLN